MQNFPRATYTTREAALPLPSAFRGAQAIPTSHSECSGLSRVPRRPCAHWPARFQDFPPSVSRPRGSRDVTAEDFADQGRSRAASPLQAPVGTSSRDLMGTAREMACGLQPAPQGREGGRAAGHHIQLDHPQRRVAVPRSVSTVLRCLHPCFFGVPRAVRVILADSGPAACSGPWGLQGWEGPPATPGTGPQASVWGSSRAGCRCTGGWREGGLAGLGQLPRRKHLATRLQQEVTPCLRPHSAWVGAPWGPGGDGPAWRQGTLAEGPRDLVTAGSGEDWGQEKPLGPWAVAVLLLPERVVPALSLEQAVGGQEWL